MQRSEAHGPGEGLKAGRSHRKGVGGFWNTLVLSRASVAPCSLFHAGTLMSCPLGRTYKYTGGGCGEGTLGCNIHGSVLESRES